MNETIKTQLNHRTIRAFTAEAVPKEHVQTLLDVANHTATSNGMQAYSIIRITDQHLKDQLAEIGNQDYMARATELWLFIVDLYRNYAIAEAQGVAGDDLINADKFFQGFTDASLAAQNVVVAAESLGYGCNYFGNVHNDLEAIIELLELPLYTLPVVGLGIGVPNQNPQLKPRMPLALKVFENQYQKEDDYLASLKAYDEEMQTYYDLREANKRVDSFTLQVARKQTSTIFKRNAPLEVARKQGFKL